jgi:hypothetical protein
LSGSIFRVRVKKDFGQEALRFKAEDAEFVKVVKTNFDNALSVKTTTSISKQENSNLKFVNYMVSTTVYWSRDRLVNGDTTIELRFNSVKKASEFC